MADKNTTKASDKINRADIRSTVDGTFLLYKNRPLVREENILCYGSLDEGYVVEMVIMSMKEYKGNEVPDKVFVQLLSRIVCTAILSCVQPIRRFCSRRSCISGAHTLTEPFSAFVGSLFGDFHCS